MNITYTSINNTCFGETSGKIFISNISFGAAEKSLYEDYLIQWGGDINNESVLVSNDGLTASNLPNGTYTFKIISTSSTSESELYTITITSPSELKISELKYSENFCNNNGYIYAKISGGVAPYFCSISSQSQTLNSTDVKFNNLSPGEYTVLLNDSSGCSYTWPEVITINNSVISFSVIKVVPPKLLNSYGYLKCSINGYGPFSFTFFNNDTQESIFIQSLETKYLDTIEDNNYTYIFNDILIPGSYTIVVKNDSECFTTENIIIPNINPMLVYLQVEANQENEIFEYREPIPIYDTVLVPYKLIVSNSNLWQRIKDKKLKDTINFSINGAKYEFIIIKQLLNKYCIGDQNIEILRLDNDSDNWFYYFYIAPSINMNNNPDFVDAKISFIDGDESYDVILGLNKYGNLDSENMSLIRGSFILEGLEFPQFQNGGHIDISIGEPGSLDETKYYLDNVKKTSLINVYELGSVTVLNFLEQFNVLNQNVTINDVYCDISKDEYLYILNIKNILKIINNFNNINNIYLYNTQNIEYTSYINIIIVDNILFENIDGTTTNNDYTIDYFYIDENSDHLHQLYRGNQVIKNITNIKNINNGFYVIRIKDIYNNVPKNIIYKSININYDNHFLTSKKNIQNYNSKILDKFLYGDILIYIGKNNEIIQEENIPSNTIQVAPPLEPSIIDKDFVIINQTSDNTNTGTLSINLSQNIKCYIYGPKNYKKSFSVATKFTNLVPGVYTIIGDDEQLNDLGLYQNETRVAIENTTNQEIFLNFTSYNDKVFIRN